MLVALLVVLSAAPGLVLAQETPPTVPDLSLVNLVEADCGWLNAGEEDAVTGLGPITCGTLEVPENWQAPGERRLDISFVVLRSTSDAPVADPVVYLEGGPGGSSLVGVPFYASLFERFRERRDVILFDQRGTARSSPLQCSTWTIDDLFGLDLSDINGEPATDPATSDEAAEATADEAAEFELGPTASLTASALLDQARLQMSDEVARCAQELLARGVDLRQYNSVNNARDTVALVRSLGYESYNLYGISYGTRLAMVIMRDFPRSGLRSVVLDSTYPPGLSGFELYPAEPHEVVTQLFADCFLDPACNEAYPDLKARFIALLDRLEADPIDLGGGISIGAADVVEVMQGINGMVRIAPYIPSMIAELEQGETDTFLGIVTGSLFAEAAADTSDAATPEADVVAAEDEAATAAEELAPVLEDFLASVGAGDEADARSPAQTFLGTVLGYVASLPEGRSNELLVRLFLLDKLPNTRTTLWQFVERAFAGPELEAGRAALLTQVMALAEEDVVEIFRYLDGPLQALDPSADGLNGFMFNSVECHESVPFQSFEQTVETAFGLGIPQLGLNTLPMIAGQFASCEVWPSGRAPDIADRPVTSDLPTLILAGTYDLQTPLSWNKEAFVHLPNAGLLIFPMSGHGVITFSDCAAQVTAEFIDNPIYYPDSSCIADLYPEWVLPPAQ